MSETTQPKTVYGAQDLFHQCDAVPCPLASVYQAKDVCSMIGSPTACVKNASPIQVGCRKERHEVTVAQHSASCPFATLPSRRDVGKFCAAPRWDPGPDDPPTYPVRCSNRMRSTVSDRPA